MTNGGKLMDGPHEASYLAIFGEIWGNLNFDFFYSQLGDLISDCISA
jgi:hypothetical protein